MKKILVVGFLLAIVGFAWYASQWESPSLNRAYTKSAHQALYESDYYTLAYSTMGTQFLVSVAPHAPNEAINPHFPIIHMKTPAPHNAWLHIVRTDSKNRNLRRFIDSVENAEGIYPFYSLEQDFYDTPLWRYTLFDKPLSFWNGYAYAVQVDRQAKTIKCVGGIAWGFRLSDFSLRPEALPPKSISTAEWKRDWQFFKEELENFTLTE